MRLRSPRLVPLLLSLSLIAAPASAEVITFETLSESESVTTQFPGLTFSNATALTAGSTLNEQDFPPQSGVNAVLDDGGPITIVFDAPVAAFGAYFNYARR